MDDDWLTPYVAPRHLVLLVDLSPSGKAVMLQDESLEPLPLKDLPGIGAGSMLDLFDAGLVPRLLRLALSEPQSASAVLQKLARIAEDTPEVAAEILRRHLGVVLEIGRRGVPQYAAGAAATGLKQACVRGVGDLGVARWQEETPELGSSDWFAYGCGYYVIRFAVASSQILPGTAPPPALARIAVFGSVGEEEADVDTVGSRRVRTGGRIWCSSVLLARLLLGDRDLRDRLRGCSVLELGCGLGVAGIAVAGYTEAARCVLADVEPRIVEAASVNLRLAGAGSAAHGSTAVLDIRDVAAVRALALAHDVSIVICSDVIYGLLTPEDVARAVAAALPRGGRAWLLMPTRYRTGMCRAALTDALVDAGLEINSTRLVDDGGAHAAFSSNEAEQEYVLYDAASTRDKIAFAAAIPGSPGREQ